MNRESEGVGLVAAVGQFVALFQIIMFCDALPGPAGLSWLSPGLTGGEHGEHLANGCCNGLPG